MATYDALRVKVIIKKEYLSDLLYLQENNFNWEISENIIFRYFGTFDSYNANYFPIGISCEVPDEWINDKDDYGCQGDLNTGSVIDGENRIWSFQTSVKNYWYGVDVFIGNILSLVSEDVLICERYNENSDTFAPVNVFLRNPTDEYIDDLKTTLYEYE